MTDKEATVYVVDLGRSMGEKRHGRTITDLDWAMQYVWDRITNTVMRGRKTDLAGFIAMRTDDTMNDYQEHDDSFSNISVLSGLKQILTPDIRKLQEAIKPSRTYKGDVISGLVLAIQMITAQCKKLKYKREIVLVTNGTGLINSEGLDQIKDKIEEDSITLKILGPDFDDPESGVKEEDKDERKAQNETLFRDFIATLPEGSLFGTLESAISELDIPRIKEVKHMASFKGFLSLGNAGEYETALRIPIERYAKTMVAKPPTASSYVLRSGNEPGEETDPATSQAPVEGGSLVTIRTSRTYQVADESAPGGKADVERDQLAKGYEYGRTVVPITDMDENITMLTTFAGMEIIGFVADDKYGRYMQMGNVNMLVASKGNQKASLALSSLIHALFEAENYAVARLVTKESKPPMLVLLAPCLESDFEGLLEIQLPFAEDLRAYQFPPLDKVMTVSGKIVNEHRNLPNDALQDAMDQYVDSMELDLKDDDGHVINEVPIDYSYSPLLHRLQSAVRWRAINPNGAIEEPSATLTKFSHPDEELVKKSQAQLEKLITAADVKKGRKRNRETEKPLSGLDVDALLNLEPKRAKISAENAIPEFKQLVSRADTVESIHDAVKQMVHIIEEQIKYSLGDSNYERVVEGLGTVREELVEYEEPGIYNDLLPALKNKIFNESLGGDRKELWWLIRKGKLGLIGQNESESSTVSEEEATKFLAAV
ncbi:uncharacterized protein N7483_000231 [Penicillium malachiteum]|uniref:uncharacterized protein n=1 Tax=Penicillium malachiteum TaxID=1324776 RepID=UPI002549433E|nr:uncharacterized protein N7483_000231 [Penicillium malachiteum]KAJ5735106.1 hypothetical protein N7483_000231 [Penicillium malachiteum]